MPPQAVVYRLILISSSIFVFFESTTIALHELKIIPKEHPSDCTLL